MALGRVFDKFRKKTRIQPEEEMYMDELGPSPMGEGWLPEELYGGNPRMWGPEGMSQPPSYGAPPTNPYAGAPGRVTQGMMRGAGRNLMGGMAGQALSPAGLSGRKLSEALQRFGNPEEERGY